MQSARGFEYGVRHIISPESGLLSDVLIGTLDLPLENVRELLRMGSVYLNHIRVLQDQHVQANDYIRAHTRPRRFLPNDGKWDQRILFQDEHLLIVDKPSGLPVNASVDNTLENTQSYLEALLDTKIFGTHRLDVATSGLIVFTKSKEAQRAFNKLLIERAVDKIYLCQVEGNFPQRLGKVVHYMEPSPRAPKTVSTEPHEGWLECLLEILSVENLGDSSQLKIRLHTGRTHQIRAQLAALNFPILGDKAYGGGTIDGEFESIHLRASELAFSHPLTEEPLQFKLDRQSF